MHSIALHLIFPWRQGEIQIPFILSKANSLSAASAEGQDARGQQLHLVEIRVKTERSYDIFPRSLLTPSQCNGI